MKSRFYVLLIMLNLGSHFCAAQTEKGVLLLGGNANFDFGLSKSNDGTYIQIQPIVARFVANNLALGGVLGFSYNKVGSVAITTVAVTPMARYYFGSNSIRPFLVGQAGYAHAAVDDDFFGKSSSEGLIFTGGAGLAAFLNQHIGLEVTLASSKGTGDINGATLSLHFGFLAYLGN